MLKPLLTEDILFLSDILCLDFNFMGSLSFKIVYFEPIGFYVIMTNTELILLAIKISADLRRTRKHRSFSSPPFKSNAVFVGVLSFSGMLR